MYAIYEVTGNLSEGSFLPNVVVQIPKFDAKPKSNFNPNPSPNPNLTLTLTLILALTLILIILILTPNSNPNPNPKPNPNLAYTFRKMSLRTSELLPIYDAVLSFCRRR